MLPAALILQQEAAKGKSTGNESSFKAANEKAEKKLGK
jgi:hypothetical protein